MLSYWLSSNCQDQNSGPKTYLSKSATHPEPGEGLWSMQGRNGVVAEVQLTEGGGSGRTEGGDRHA